MALAHRKSVSCTVQFSTVQYSTVQCSYLSRQDLRPGEEVWPRVLALVPAGRVLRAVEVSVLGESLVSQGTSRPSLHLKLLSKCRPPPHVKVVCLVGLGGLGEGPELVLVVLGPYQGGDHRQRPPERPVSLRADQQLVSESRSVAGP